MDCRAFDALNPTLLALTGKLLLVTPLCDCLALSRLVASSSRVASELLCCLRAKLSAPSAFASYAKTPCRLFLFYLLFLLLSARLTLLALALLILILLYLLLILPFDIYLSLFLPPPLLLLDDALLSYSSLISV